MEAQLFYARRGPLQYGERVPEDIKERDEIFSLRGERNDERLVRQGQVALVSPHARPSQCGECGKKFLTEGAREHHGMRMHKRTSEEIVHDAVRETEARIKRDLEAKTAVDVTATVGDSEDRKAERAEKRLNEEAPIFWEKTEAAMKAGDAPVPEIVTAPAPKPRKRPAVRKE